VRGAIGQQKAPETLLDRRTVLPNAPARIELAPQVIVEKQALDCFTNQNLPALLEALGADRYVVYGVVTEYCVRCAALGLAKTGKQVEVVADAVQSLSGEAGQAAFDELAAAGVSLTTVSACSGET
jgi:nicotinamidase/pyrazinamidase